MSLHVESGIPGFTGRFVTAQDADYDTVRKVWNGAIDHKPAVIAQCTRADDVAAALAYARERGLEVSVRGGAHQFAGNAVWPDSLTIDLSPMNTVAVDPQARVARCQGGALLSHLDAATQEHGLAVPAGTISHTGVGGLTLGGGFGWLTHDHGLSIDNLLSAQVVLADGRIVEASPDSHPDLFWALRGGGGNFGVVTEFRFLLHPVGPMVNVALLFWPLNQGTEALRLIRETVTGLPARANALLAAGLCAPPEPFVPQEHHFTPGYALVIAGFGTAEEHAAIIEPMRAALPPLFDFASPIPYTALQRMLDDAAPPGILAYERALYLDELTDAAIDVMAEFSAKKNSPMSFAPVFRVDGAFAAVDDDATAFGGERRSGYVVNFAAVAPSTDLLEADTAWVRAYWEAMLPHSRGAGSYVNFLVEPEQDRVRAAYGPKKYERLAKIKAEYDPENVFRHNANIKPAV
ncbi:MAG TPA: FAD-binding oxidoreductase [Actinocrinis sp.]|nr:FAD-binding oxidoreductase [Actinocrinis sp.]